MQFSVIVPASSANLGPGFDSIAIALSRYLTVEIRTGTAHATNIQQAELDGGDDLVIHAMQRVAAAAALPLPDVDLRVESCIPVARGLGSSAAALIAGLLAGNTLLGNPFDEPQLLKLAARIEGHADNVAAALYGGGALAVPLDAGHQVVSLAINVDLRAVVLVPDWASLTTNARATLPLSYSRTDAVFNASRCALLVHALANGKPELLREAMRDRIHQPYRAAMYSHLEGAIAGALDAGAFGASLSGAGPAVIAFAEASNVDDVSSAMLNAATRSSVRATAICLEIEREGAKVIYRADD